MSRLTRVALFRALAFRSFALVWAGQAVSRLGDSLYTIAISWWVVDETGSAAALGLVLACDTVPQLIFLLIGGVAGDRFSRLRLMLGADLIRALAVGGVALLAWQDALEIWHLCLLSAVFGSVSAIFFPAYLAAVPDLLPAEDLPSANSLRFISRQAADLAGPGVGAGLIALGGSALAFALNAASFLVAAAAVAAVARDPALHRRIGSTTSALQDLRAGFATVLGSPWLWMGIGIAGVSDFTFGGPQEAVLPSLVKEGRGEGVGVLALLNALLALGALLAAIAIGQAGCLRRRAWLMYGGWAISALALAVVGLPLPLPLIGAAMLFVGAGGTVVTLTWAQTVQEMVPRDLLGRVFSIDALGSYALLPLGYLLAGLAADHVDPGPVLVTGGLISAAVISLGLLHPKVRAVD